MWYWIVLILIPIMVLAFFEEMIYFFVNRSIFGRSKLEQKCRNGLKYIFHKRVPNNQNK